MNYSKVHAELDQRVLAFYLQPKGKREEKNPEVPGRQRGHGVLSTAHQRPQCLSWLELAFGAHSEPHVWGVNEHDSKTALAEVFHFIIKVTAPCRSIGADLSTSCEESVGEDTHLMIPMHKLAVFVYCSLI